MSVSASASASASTSARIGSNPYRKNRVDVGSPDAFSLGSAGRMARDREEIESSKDPEDKVGENDASMENGD